MLMKNIKVHYNIINGHLVLDQKSMIYLYEDIFNDWERVMLTKDDSMEIFSPLGRKITENH
jgi:hypothetical protein